MAADGDLILRSDDTHKQLRFDPLEERRTGVRQ